jgi:hypothetical protein
MSFLTRSKDRAEGSLFKTSNKKNNENNENNINNVSFLFNQNEFNQNENQKKNGNNKKSKNKKSENKRSELNNYLKSQKDSFNTELMITCLATTSLFSNLQDKWDKTPFSIKMGYLFILGVLLYYNLFFHYNLYFAFLFSLLFSIILFLINKYLGIITLIILLLIVYNQYSYDIKLQGTIMNSTEIVKNKVYNGKINHEFISNTKIPREGTPGVSSYGFWVYLNKPFNNNQIYRNDEWKSIFYRGSSLDSQNSIYNLVQYPGVWLKPDNQTLAIVFKNSGATTESVELPNIEFNKWNHFYITCVNKSVTMYKNGKLELSSTLLQTPLSMNDYGIYITSDYALAQMDDMSGMGTNEEDTNYQGRTGFDGNIAYLTYYDYTLTPSEIEDAYEIYKKKINDYQSFKEKQIENVDVKTLFE